MNTRRHQSHMAFALGLFERMEDKMLRECFTGGTVKDIRQHIADLRKQGLKYYPCCDNTDAEGRCKGVPID